MPAPLIEFKGAQLGYGKKTILRNVSCVVHPGESVGLVGQNGSGKTTFLRAVLGMLRVQPGEVSVDRKHQFAYVPQVENLNFFWPLSVRETVLLPAKSKRLFSRVTPEEEAAAQDAMQRVGVAPIADLLFRDASGGQRQKTILAQALSQKPDVLLLDEPTQGLDVAAEKDLLELIVKLRRDSGLTLLFVTHSLQIALNFMEKIFLFDKGSVFSTTPDEIVRTKRLEEIYGIPFAHHEDNGVRWVMPIAEKR